MSFSQKTGPFVVAWFIGFISTVKGCGIDRAVEVPLYTFFLSDRRGR
jgi:hypothetical protein